MPVLEILLPVFLIVLLGTILTRVGFLSAGVLGELNRLVYWVGLPSFLFESLAKASFGSGAVPLSGVLLGTTVLVGIVACGVAALRGLPRESWGTFVQAATRGNIAYVGLAVIALASDHAAMGATDMRALALLSMAPTIVLFNVIAVGGLAASRRNAGASVLRSATVELVTNPLLIALALGALVSWSGLALPVWFHKSVYTTGHMALPLALICIGGALVTTKLQGRRVSSFLASFLKIAVAPAIGLALAKLVGLGADETRIALIFLATPTAAASFVLVGKMGGDTPLAAGSVVVSTLLSVLSLAAVLALA